MAQTLVDHAVDIIRSNDQGNYTVPTHGLYPFQWNWDSALTALGISFFDESRAWTELATLMEHQWDDGMVPHIVFHKEDEGYFPGPDVWQTSRKVPTSGITQPPVAGFAARKLFERAKDTALSAAQAKELLPKIDAWHDWFYRCRDPEGTGLVALVHPWESGRDNSVDWDIAFQRVPTDGVMPFQRRDLQHADASHRPTQAQYERYIYLVQLFRSLNWDNTKLHDASPFQIVDPGFNAILIRSCADLADLADHLGAPEIAARNRARAERGAQAMESLWSDTHSQYLCFDRKLGEHVDNPSIAGLLAVVAPIPDNRAAQIADRIVKLGDTCRYLVPSQPPDTALFDGKRYWRGPVWLIVNYMISDGLKNANQGAVAERIIDHSLDLISNSGFAEYYDPHTGEPCGGKSFTWTAAMVIEFLTHAGAAR
ncbi:MAG: trehalase family glycosidase [Pseudomonadota bacterium]